MYKNRKKEVYLVKQPLVSYIYFPNVSCTFCFETRLTETNIWELLLIQKHEMQELLVAVQHSIWKPINHNKKYIDDMLI